MDKKIEELLDKQTEKVADLYDKTRQIVYESTGEPLTETLWAKLPSYCVGEKFVRLIPFKDHINIEAAAIIHYKDELSGYKITPKGMLQIFVGQEIPADILNKIFKETLG